MPPMLKAGIPMNLRGLVVCITSAACSGSTKAPRAGPSDDSSTARPAVVSAALRGEWMAYVDYYNVMFAHANLDDFGTWNRTANHFRAVGKELARRLNQVAALKSQLEPLIEDEISQRLVPEEDVDDIRTLNEAYGEWIKSQRRSTNDLLRCVELPFSAAVSCLRDSASTNGAESDDLARQILQLHESLYGETSFSYE